LGVTNLEKCTFITEDNSKVENPKRVTELMNLEAEFAKKHKRDTDEELIRYIKDTAEKLGHIPNKREVRGYALIKSRLGPWPRVLEMAGLKKKG
jgi:predicted metal-dependent hydrolase